MKNKMLLLTLLSPFAHSAYAQSSVTLYGLIDEGLEVANNVQNGAHT